MQTASSAPRKAVRRGRVATVSSRSFFRLSSMGEMYSVSVSSSSGCDCSSGRRRLCLRRLFFFYTFHYSFCCRLLCRGCFTRRFQNLQNLLRLFHCPDSIHRLLPQFLSSPAHTLSRPLTVLPEPPEFPAVLFYYPPISPVLFSPQQTLPSAAPSPPSPSAMSCHARWDPHEPYRDTVPRSLRSDAIPLPVPSASLRYSDPEAGRWP